MTDIPITTGPHRRPARLTGRRTARLAAMIAALAAFAAGPAYASKDAEAYIGAKAQGAISSLAEAGAPDARAARFGALTGWNTKARGLRLARFFYAPPFFHGPGAESSGEPHD